MADTKKPRAFVEQRRRTILSIIKEHGRASVASLAQQLDISPLTVRRDLDQLEAEGQIYRRYGEAILVNRDTPTAGNEYPFAKQLERIAEAAAEYVNNDDLLFINTSTTALKTVPYITASGVTIITNSMKAIDLPCPTNGQILVTGGEVRPPRGVLSGDFALNNIRNISAMISFTGCAGISIGAGVTSTTQQEAMVNSQMIEHSEKHIVCADSSKLNTAAGFTYAPLSSVDLLITDTGVTDEEAQILLDCGIKEIKRV